MPITVDDKASIPKELEEGDLPLNTFSPKKPFKAKIKSVERIVGPKATGETCHIIVETDGKIPFWEGQSYGVIPPVSFRILFLKLSQCMEVTTISQQEITSLLSFCLMLIWRSSELAARQFDAYLLKGSGVLNLLRLTSLVCLQVPAIMIDRNSSSVRTIFASFICNLEIVSSFQL